jgi:SecD/SecF fusion protein
MFKNVRNRLLLLGILVLAAIVCFLPSVTGGLPGWWGKVLPGEGMRLGLDLQGGMNLILKVNLPRAVQNQLEQSIADLRESLREKHIVTSPVESLGTNLSRLRLADSSAAESVKEMLMADFPNLAIQSSSLQEGTVYLDLALKDSEVQQIRDNAVAQSLEVIRNRIDQFGVTEPMIVRQGQDEIVVQLPGIKDPQRALELIGRTAQLEFKLVDTQAQVNLAALIDAAVQSGLLKKKSSHEELNRALKGKIPPDTEVYLEKRVDSETGAVTMIPLLLKKKTVMTGEALKTAHVEIGGRFGEPIVGLSFNARGARLFERITEEHVGQQLAIILDDVVLSAPVIRERISGGNAQITGSFTTEEASDLAIALRAGALPAPVDIVQNLTVGPSLGKDSIHNGIAATVLGTVLVIAFMIVYYRVSGIIANLALLLNVLLLLAVLSLFHATLTLPGIAGIVLSIGMAVDSNVLIFERMREELALQKPLWSSVEGGYRKALWTIIDSHVTTLITAFALFLFGTGPIKGFAVTLSVGVILNLFTALYGTRTVYQYLRLKNWLKGLRFLQLIHKPRIDFIRLRHAAFLLSGVLVLLGLVAFVQIERGKANLGVDLSGGTMVQFKADKAFQLGDIRTALARQGLSDCELQDVPREQIVIVRVKKSDLSVGQAADQVASALSRELPQIKFTMESRAEIGSSVSQDLKRAALIAISISLAGIIVYLAWRFDLRFGVAAAVATFHDVLTVLGIFYLLHKEITLLVVTALLTLAGYSLTDTVVVFDRIRENLGRAGKQNLGDVINRSINEVLSRTIITSTTVALVLVALLVMGGILLRDFALALLIGVVVGTYSSIFVASPIVYIWPARKPVPAKGVARARKHPA